MTNVNTQTIEIIETRPNGHQMQYDCLGVVDALVKFGSGVRDDDHEAFTKAGYELQKEGVTAAEIAQVFNKFTENVVHVAFVN